MGMDQGTGNQSAMSKASSTNSFIQIEEGEIVDVESPDIVFEQDELFAIDLNPENEDENEALVKATMGSKLNKTLVGLGGPGDATESTKETPRHITCFNCDGAHRLDECPVPRDNRRITRNRSFHNQRKEGGMRMHSTPQSLNYKPGEISDKLRKALGIGRDDIPEWIFRMRNKGKMEGYPPGWMNVALEPDTFMFIEGNDDAKPKQPVKINPEKLVCFPGFNHYDKRLEIFQEMKSPIIFPYLTTSRRSIRNGSRKTLQRPKGFKSLGATDVEIVEQTNTTDTHSILSAPPTTPGLQTPQQPTRTDTPDHVEQPSNVTTGRSRVTVIHGTPIILDRPSSLSQPIEKPDLSKWSEGIVPFQHFEENTGKKGFLKEMMSMLNEFKQQTK